MSESRDVDKNVKKSQHFHDSTLKYEELELDIRSCFSRSVAGSSERSRVRTPSSMQIASSKQIRQTQLKRHLRSFN